MYVGPCGLASQYFVVKSGLRQGSIIITVIVHFVHECIYKSVTVVCGISAIGIGINNHRVGCIIYADDAIIISYTISGLQYMLSVCYAVSVNVNLLFNLRNQYVLLLAPGGITTAQSNMYLGASTTNQSIEVKGKKVKGSSLDIASLTILNTALYNLGSGS